MQFIKETIFANWMCRTAIPLFI